MTSSVSGSEIAYSNFATTALSIEFVQIGNVGVSSTISSGSPKRQMVVAVGFEGHQVELR